MELKTYKLYYGGNLMPWGKGTVVKNPNGWIFLGGTEGIDPNSSRADQMATEIAPVDVVPGAEAQARLCFEKIKSALEEMGSSLDKIVKIWFYIVGDYPEGLARSDTWQTICKVREEYFRKYAPQLCIDNNPPTVDLIGVKCLAVPEMVVEVAVVAVF